ncbi:hypothetical protein GJR88_01614 [Dietzia sp. DQ12-45-1b]|nr:hypothetical protein GJR88_01614 [Dietzia sp. DQ12-45-1b]
MAPVERGSGRGRSRRWRVGMRTVGQGLLGTRSVSLCSVGHSSGTRR